MTNAFVPAFPQFLWKTIKFKVGRGMECTNVNDVFRFPPDRRMAFAGYSRTVLLRTKFFRFPQERRMAFAGFSHTVLLRSDGQAVACGWDYHGQCSIPPLEEGISYSQVSAGVSHTLLLRSDGQAVACGARANGQCSIPPLDEGLSYCQVSAGNGHTVLLRSDGQAVACGVRHERYSIPPLDQGISYSHVSAGGNHTVLLEMMAKLSLAAQIMMDSAAFRPWMKDFHI